MGMRGPHRVSAIKTYSVEHLIGKEVGTSTILKELSRGSMAIVFTAFQRTLKRKIAVKVLPKQLLTPAAAVRFQQEAEAAAILSHPNIIPIYEVGDTDEFLFMSMQLIEGNDLLHYINLAQHNVIPSKRFIPLKTSIQIVSQVLEALDYAHTQGIIHRDIKPANILIEKQIKRPLISDFGVAKSVKGDNPDEDQIQGTPLYMAPEQILSSDIDGRADIYATGVMLFQMLVFRLPTPRYDSLYSLLNDKEMNKSGIFQNQPSELNPTLNSDMDRIIKKATAYYPDHRFASCAEFRKALTWYKAKYLNQGD